MDRNEFFQALPITGVTLKLIGASLEICTDDIEDVHVMISGDSRDVSALRASISADRLIIEQPAAAIARSPLSAGWMQLTLRLPRSWKGSIDARTVSGWINARGLSGADLSLDTVSGTIMAADLTFITATLRSVTGDITLTGAQLDKGSFAATSGSVTIAPATMRSLSVSTVTGGIRAALTEPFADASINTVSGHAYIEAPVEDCDAVLRSVSGRLSTSEVSIREDAPARLRAASVAGDLTLVNTLEPQ